MFVVVATLVGVLLISLTVHEAAHALVLRRLGVPIDRAGIGLPIFPVVSTSFGGQLPFSLTLSPWLVGAYVSHDEKYNEQVSALPYRDRAWYLNAGIVANVVLGFAAWAPVAAMSDNYLRAVGLAGLAVATWLARRPLAAYVAPALAPIALGVLLFGLISSWMAGEIGVGYAGLLDLVPTGDAVQALRFLGLISILLAIVNAVPLFGTDNSKVVLMLIERWASPKVAAVYRATGLALLASLLLLSLATDLWAAGKAGLDALLG